MNLSAKKVSIVLALVALFLVFMSVASYLDRIYLGIGNSWGSVRLFSVDREGGIPAWYSTALLLFCFILLAVIAAASRMENHRDYFYWVGLSVGFLYLSADEAARIHERFLPLGRSMLDAIGVASTGALARAWVVPGILITLVFILVYLRFFFRLPLVTRLLFFAAGLVFLGGAVGVEMLTGLYLNSYGGERGTALSPTVVRLILPNIEELFEMLGVIVFIYALVSYISATVKEVEVRVT